MTDIALDAEAAIDRANTAYFRLCNMASTIGWWVCPGGFDASTGEVNVYIYPERGLPTMEMVRKRLVSPQSTEEAVGIYQSPDCAVPEPVVFYIGNVHNGLERVIRSLPKAKRPRRSN